MNDGAEALFDSLTSYQTLERLIENGDAEGLHLECKAPVQPRVTREIKAKLAEAASGFANTAGGVIAWGLSTTKHAHSGLDVITQIEPIGACLSFQRQLEAVLPTLTTPPILEAKFRTIRKRVKDMQGVVLAYIPRSQGDPAQSVPDNLFYFRSGDEFVVAPYEMIRRLFASSQSPDLRPVFDSRLVKLNKDASWHIPIALQNLSSAVARDVLVSVQIINPAVVEWAKSAEFRDRSNVNPGKLIFMAEPKSLIRRGINSIVGNLQLTMKMGRRPRRRVDIRISLHADKMTARWYHLCVKLQKKAFSVKLLEQGTEY